VPDQARQTPRTGCAAQRCIVDARVDPFNEQGKPRSSNRFLGDCFAVTLQNTYSVTETLGPPAMGPTDMPLVTLPSASAPTSGQVFRQRTVGQVQHPSDRDNARRGTDERQQRLDHA
jgi:hypothetical protein